MFLRFNLSHYPEPFYIMCVLLTHTYERSDDLNSLQSGLPDGLFSHQKSQFESILEDLRMKNVCIFYDHLEYFTATWYNLWPFGHLVCFPILVCLYQEKSGNPVCNALLLILTANNSH
jgi:hypothetical protein